MPDATPGIMAPAATVPLRQSGNSGKPGPHLLHIVSESSLCRTTRGLSRLRMIVRLRWVKEEPGVDVSDRFIEDVFHALAKTPPTFRIVTRVGHRDNTDFDVPP